MTETIGQQIALRQYIRERSPEAFEALFRRHLDWVYSAALRQVGDPGAAGDVTQAVFLVLAKKGGKLAEDTPLSTWLFKVLRLEALAFLRGRRRRERREREAAMGRREVAERDQSAVD